MIKAVFIDVDDTLLDFILCAGKAMKMGFEKFGLVYKDEYLDTFVTENGKLWREIEKGNLTVKELHKIRWNIIFNCLGIECDGVTFEEAFLENLKESAETVPYAKEIMLYLKNMGYILCVATNGPKAQQFARLKKAGLFEFCDNIFVSEEIGVSKPKKEYFDGCFKLLPKDIKPEECIMIGDSLTSDIEGGINYGMKTCYFNRKKAPLPDDLKIDYTVSNLREIEGIL